jgi:APA family basic amino acid/polyamine antiporter
MKTLLRIRSIFSNRKPKLKRSLGLFDLILFAIGAVVGAGIFVFPGFTAATITGPAITISYLLAGFACAMTALCYAELAAAIENCGGPYSYAYVSFGELIAWIVGWNLILEYGVATSTIALAWSGYVNCMLQGLGVHIAHSLVACPFEGGMVNIPAVFILLIMAITLAGGMSHSVMVNRVMVTIKFIEIAVFVVFASKHFQIANWHPFMPFGWEGVTTGAGLVFFAYIGFDVVSTAAEEAVNPKRNLPLAMLISLVICIFLYVLITGLLTGISSYKTLDFHSPISTALSMHAENWAAMLISIGAVAGLTSVILVLYYALTRVVLAMSRDGLFPRQWALISKESKTPVHIVLICGLVIAIIAGLVPIQFLAQIASIGTLLTFVIVCGGVIYLRHTKPDLKRPFKLPFFPWVPLIGILSCIYLMAHLKHITLIHFLFWSILGLCLYFGYAKKHSVLRKDEPS